MLKQVFMHEGFMELGPGFWIPEIVEEKKAENPSQNITMFSLNYDHPSLHYGPPYMYINV